MTLLYDSVTLAMHAQSAPDHEFQDTLARAAIVASMLYIEACANCCLSLLSLTSRFSEEIDRLPTGAKLDLFLRLKYKNRILDRSRVEYQGFVELRRFRDAFVHPKAQKYEWIEWAEEESVSASPRTNLLSLPTIPSFCGPPDAAIAIRATHIFVGHFFRDLCRMKPTSVATLLTSYDQVPGTRSQLIPYWRSHVHAWLARESIDLSYIRIGKL